MADSISLKGYKAQLPESLRPRTICFLVNQNRVLLGRRKEGIGTNNWVGIGGKVEAGETIEQAAIREMLEEVYVRPKQFEEVAVIDFYFPFADNPKKWNQRVHAFIVKEWEGEPQESTEILPQWFGFNQLPFDNMWSDAPHWLPKILEGKKLKADFLYSKDLDIQEMEIREI